MNLERLRKARERYRQSAKAERGASSDLFAFCMARGQQAIADKPTLRYEFALDAVRSDYAELLAAIDEVLANN